MVVDRGFAYALAKEVLKDSLDNEEAKMILSKPKYRLDNEFFDSEQELNKAKEKRYKDIADNLCSILREK